jgi:hypothetical protein
MTFLTLINRVLIRLRETSAVSPTDNDYVVLIGYLVNDAKEIVEKAWDWSGLRTTATVSATVGDATYTLTGFGLDFKLSDAYNDTQNCRLKLISSQLMTSWTSLSDTPSGPPSHFSYAGNDSNGDPNIIVWPTPDGSYTLKFDATVREAELTNASDATALPTKPIEMYAWALATRERGETGGASAQEIFAIADKALGDAIALDASRYPAELTWTVV